MSMPTSHSFNQGNMDVFFLRYISLLGKQVTIVTNVFSHVFSQPNFLTSSHFIDDYRTSLSMDSTFLLYTNKLPDVFPQKSVSSGSFLIAYISSFFHFKGCNKYIILFTSIK